jgi:hypothetical protein
VTLDNLIGRGLEREATDRAEVARFLARIERKLTDSRSNAISLDSRFDLAWEAVLQMGLTALRANGLRTTSQAGHQALAIQTLDKSIGVDKDTIRLLETFRKNRSAGLYEGSFEPSQAEVDSLIRAALGLRQTLLRWLAASHPALLTDPKNSS